MKKWADYLISEVSYDPEHLIFVATRHQDTEKGITQGKPVDRLTIASDIKNGLFYITIYSGNNSWKKGHKLETFSIGGSPYLRIDGNKVKLDYLGDLPESKFEESIKIQELESQPEPVTEPEPPSSPRGSLPKESAEELPQELDLVPEPVTEPEPPSSPRGSLPKESAEELPQELDLVPEPVTEPEEEEATPEQLSQFNELQQQIDDLENVLSKQKFSEPVTEPEEEEATPEQLSQFHELQQQIDDLENVLSKQKFSELVTEPEVEEATPEQFSKVKELEKEIEKLEAVDIEHEIIQTLRKQNKKLDDIENKLHISDVVENKIPDSVSQDAYCVKCKTKRIIKNPEETIMKNGRPAIKGFCSVCNCKVFRIGKMKK